MVPKRLLQLIGQGNYLAFYWSKEWRRKRKEILKRDNNECQLCKAMGKVTVDIKDSPLEVHHIKELKDVPELALTNSNLISLCINCHNKEHDRLKVTRKPKLDVPERW